MSGSRGPKSAADRVERLLQMLPWLAGRTSVHVDEMAAQFGITARELVAELEVASTCGLPPYTPDMLAGFWIEDDGMIHVYGEVQFDRRLSLTRDEAFGLALLGAAAGSIGGFRRSRALRSALKKLDRILGENTVQVDIENPPFLEAVNDAAAAGERLDIEYWNPSRNEVTNRRITVRSVFLFRGHWYVRADDDLRGAQRTFRVDRMKKVTPTGEHVDVVDGPGTAPEFFASQNEGETVTLRLQPSAHWAIETYPHISATENPDGSVDVTLVVNSEHWLRRLLLRAGTSAEVIAPAAWVGLGSRAARDVLARYR